MATTIITFVFTCIFAPLQGTSVGWQSLTVLSNTGARFSSADEQALLLANTTADSWRSCSGECHSTARCRFFDYDPSSLRCRLFEGDMQSTDMAVFSSSSDSVVGSIQLHSDLFADRGSPCSSCMGSRYLRCVNDTCECEVNTFFDGSICRSQAMLGDACAISAGCRQDLNLTCLPRQQCAPSSIQTGTAIGGFGNGTSGNGLEALCTPMGLAVGMDDALYVAEKCNHRVTRLREDSRLGSVVAGTGVRGNASDQLNDPTVVYVDAASNVYVADNGNSRIMLWRANATSGIRVAGNGSSGSSLRTFGTVSGLLVDSMGNMYVCDQTNHRVLKFPPNSTDAVLVAGTGISGSGSSQLNTPGGLVIDEINSYLYVADILNHRVQRFHLGVSTVGVTVAGGSGAGSANNQLSMPVSLCISKITGAMYIAEWGNDRIQKWNSGASSAVTIAGTGAMVTNASTPLAGPMIIRLSNNESHLFVSHVNYNTIWRFPLV